MSENEAALLVTGLAEEDRLYSTLAAKDPEVRALYAPLAGFLSETFPGRPYSLLELGCGRGTLCFSLERNCRYTGVDRSPAAIRRANRRFPSRRFVRSDLASILPRLHRQFNVIVLSRFLSKYCEGGVKPMPLLSYCCDHLLLPGGVMAFVEPFTYGSTPGLSAKARWTYLMIQNLSKNLTLEECYAGLALQPDHTARPVPHRSSGASVTVIRRKVA